MRVLTFTRKAGTDSVVRSRGFSAKRNKSEPTHKLFWGNSGQFLRSEDMVLAIQCSIPPPHELSKGGMILLEKGGMATGLRAMVIAFHLIEKNTVRRPNVPDIEVLPVFVRVIKQIFVGLSCPTF
jgi:hypothetical protein